MGKSRSPIFTLHTDPDHPEVQWVTVDGWTAAALLAPSLINSENAGASIRFEGTVRFKAANGDAEYRVTGWDADAHALVLELVAWSGPTSG